MSQGDDRRVDVVILTAIRLEFHAVLSVDAGAAPQSVWEQRTGPSGLPVAFRSFMGRNGRVLRAAAAVAPDIGATAAVNTLLPLAEWLKPRCIAMCGVCAGRPGKVGLGDVIAADRLYYHDTGKQGPGGVEQDLMVYPQRDDWTAAFQAMDPGARFRGEAWFQARPLTTEWRERRALVALRDQLPRPWQAVDPALAAGDWKAIVESLRARGLLEAAGRELTADGRRFVDQLLFDHMDALPDLTPTGALHPFRLHVAPIGSGSRVIEDERIWSFVSKAMRKTLSIEMEAAVVGEIAHRQRQHRLDWVVMKGVMDLADHGRDDHFKEFAARVSAECLMWFLREHGIADLVVPEVVAHSNLLIREPRFFVGRDDLLASIAAELDARPGQVAIVALHGLRGVGKSTLAAVLAHRQRSRFQVTWWVRAHSEASLRSDLAALGIRAGWVDPEDKEDAAFAKVMQRLHGDGAGVLLVYDNAIDAETLKPYLPVGGASRVLITSNAHAWRGLAAPIELRTWPAEVGAEFLVKRSGRPSAGAAELSRALGGLPLAHEQAAAYCEHLEIDLGDYLGRFAARPAVLLDDPSHAPTEYHDRRTVARTFTLAIEQAARLHPAAELLISYAALLPPEPIPLFLFFEAAGELGEVMAGVAGSGLEPVVAALRTFALIDREAVVDERDPSIRTEAIRLHRLVREVASARCSADQVARYEGALVNALGAVYTRHSPWHRARRLDPLASFVLDRRTTPPADDTPAAVSLRRAVAAYRLEVLASRYAEAEAQLRHVLAYHEHTIGANHATTLETMHDLAFCIRARGDLQAAMDWYRRVIELRKDSLGPRHRATLESMNHLAFCMQRAGDLDGAERIIREVIAAQDEQPEDSDTLIVLRNLALLVQTRGDLSAAEVLYRRVYDGQLRVLGPRHGLTIETIIDLAHCLKAQRKFQSAAELYGQALEQAEQLFGPDHVTSISAREGLTGCSGAEPRGAS